MFGALTSRYYLAMRSIRLVLVGLLLLSATFISVGTRESHVNADAITGSPITVNGSACYLDTSNENVYANTSGGIQKFSTSNFAQVASAAIPVNNAVWVSPVSDIGFLSGGSVPNFPATDTIKRYQPSSLTSGASIVLPHVATAFAVNQAGTKAFVVGWRQSESTVSGTNGKLSIIDLGNNSVESVSLGDLQPWSVTLLSDEENVYVGGEAFEVGKGWVRGKILKISLATLIVTDFYSSTWAIDSITHDSSYIYARIYNSRPYGQNNLTDTSGIARIQPADGQVVKTLITSGRFNAKISVSPDGNFLYNALDNNLVKINLSTFTVAQNLEFSAPVQCFDISDSGTFAVVSLFLSLVDEQWVYSNNVQRISLTATEPQVITFPTISSPLLGIRRVSLTSTASSGLVTSYSSATPTVCTVSGSTVSLLTVGSCTINADQSGGSGWAAAPTVAQTFSVLAQTISFSPPTTAFTGDKAIDLSATATSGLNVVFTSATTAVCTVKDNVVSIVTKGTCSIDANQSGNSDWDQAETVRKNVTILLSPPPGEPGVSIKDGSSYTNTKSVVLNLVWPSYATEARISNDGGFASSKTKVFDVDSSISWELDDSIKGVYTKVVYVRFNGTGIDITKTYSDDIILDTTAPVVESSSAAAVAGSVDVTLKATDDITGVDKVQVKNGTTTVTKDYGAKVTVTEKELGLTVSTASVRKTDSSNIEVRVSDKAGNWSAYQTLAVYRAGSTTVNTPTVNTPTVTTPTVITTTVVTTTVVAPKVTLSKSVTAKSIATYAKLAVPANSKVSMKVVASYAKSCKVSGTTLKGLKAGTCKVTVTVTPKKGRATSKTVTLKVTK